MLNVEFTNMNSFPFDDVAPNGGLDQSGAVMSGSPQVLTVSIGGLGAYA
jgi:hypothetical protein